MNPYRPSTMCRGTMKAGNKSIPYFRIFIAGCLTLLAAPAFADITGFIGATTTPANRLVRGVAAGGGLLVVGFEFEYADTTDDPSAAAPSLKSGMGNVLLQTPVP